MTDKISPSGNIIQKTQQNMYGVNTTKIATQNLVEQGQMDQTTVLSSNETTVLETQVEDTSILTEPIIGETSVLTENAPSANSFVIEFEITYIHSNEIIA